MSDQPANPPGWYPDPDGSGGQRYWDGIRWTEQIGPPAGSYDPGSIEGLGQPGAQGAGALIRFGARFLDGLILGIPLLIILSVIGADPGDGAGAQLLYGVIGTAVGLGYYTFMESSSGQTIGKKLLNLRTLGPDGGVPTQEQAFKRNAWYLVGLVPIVGGLISLGIAIWIASAISSTGRGPHDGWAGGTLVVKTTA